MGNLRQVQRTAIPILAAAKSLTEGCQAAGISTATFYAWRKNSTFTTALQKAQAEVAQAGFDALLNGVRKASEKLVGLVDASDESVSRLASRDVLDFFMRAQEDSEILKQIEAINRRLDAAGM